MTLEQVHERMAALPPEVRANPLRLFRAVLDLYESERINGTCLEENGDMLLFQWGVYDWGDGKFFELDLTRQGIPFGMEDPPILQLHCTYAYAPHAFAGIEAGDRWCSHPAELDDFRRFVFQSEALREAAGHTPTSLRTEVEDAE